MRICIAQTKPFIGDIEKNILSHKKMIELAISNEANAIFFPELSITGYSPKLAIELSTDQNDRRFDDFQKISDSNNIVVGIGIPTKADLGIKISMVIFQPRMFRQTYDKQILHSDELPFFVKGTEQLFINLLGNKIAPAICFESLQPAHARNAIELGANVYVSTVAKSKEGVDKADIYFSELAKKYSIPVLMSNCIGFCDNFLGAGKSAVWNEHGELVGELNSESEGILIYDLEEKFVRTVLLENVLSSRDN